MRSGGFGPGQRRYAAGRSGAGWRESARGRGRGCTGHRDCWHACMHGHAGAPQGCERAAQRTRPPGVRRPRRGRACSGRALALRREARRGGCGGHLRLGQVQARELHGRDAEHGRLARAGLGLHDQVRASARERHRGLLPARRGRERGRDCVPRTGCAGAVCADAGLLRCSELLH